MSNKLNIKLEDGEPTVIAWFDSFEGPNEYEFLSNFYVGEPIYIRSLDDTFQTGEHAFAAMKTVDIDDYNRIREAFDPGQAKMYGRMCKLRPDWEAVKYDAMMLVLRSKFTLDRQEGRLLMATDNALLIEGTYWDDDVWGVALSGDPLQSMGRNWLGTLLMARRAELKAQEFYDVWHPTARGNGQFVEERR